MSFILVSLLLGFACATTAVAQTAAAPELPRVALIGDSIRMGYAPLVARRLAGRAVIISPEPNGGDSSNVLRHLEEWVLREKPDVIHMNAGLHDLKKAKATGVLQVGIEDYERNLREIVRRIRAETGAALVFASTTPIHDERHSRRGTEFNRHEADVRRYNDKALQVMRELAVPVNDLHWIVEKAGPAETLAADGVHYTPAGYERLAEAVADCILRQLVIRRYTPLPTPSAGPTATEAYRKTEIERDALVPAPYRDARIPELPLPADAPGWRRSRPGIMRTVLESLGDLPPRPAPVRARIVSRELRPGYSIERVAVDNGVDGEVSALLLVPHDLRGPAPAILWLHSSTPDKTQIIIPNTNGGQESLGEMFVRAGYVVLSPDAYWHGDRAGTGPSGRAETGREEQESLFKFHLWFGRTLWGMFVRDDQVALDYLAGRPEVDKARIGTTGMSMGSTRAWWLAAVDDRVAAVVGVACLTRYQNLIRHGQLRQHGVYYWVNGLLRHFDTEGVLSLIAPRPFLALTGDLDAGSPADGIRDLEEKLAKIYSVTGSPDRFKSILYPGVGHAYTPEMRAEMFAWFERWLK